MIFCSVAFRVVLVLCWCGVVLCWCGVGVVLVWCWCGVGVVLVGCRRVACVGCVEC